VITRAFSTLLAAAAAGALIWVATQVSNGEGGYWARVAIVAGAGLALTVVRLPAPALPGRGSFPVLLDVAFLPAALAAAWVLTAAQPEASTTRDHVLNWSGDIGIGGVVDDLTPMALVVAFGVGALLGLVFEPRPAVVAAEPVPGPVAASETAPVPAREPVAAADPEETAELRTRELQHH
jgi:hypothetical protein